MSPQTMTWQELRSKLRETATRNALVAWVAALRRERGWGADQAMERDERVIEHMAPQKPEALSRMLRRLREEKSVPRAKGLERIGRVFAMGSAEQVWKHIAGMLYEGHHRPKTNRLVRGQDHFILLPGFEVETADHEIYTIEGPVERVERPGNSVSYYARGGGKAAFLKAMRVRFTDVMHFETRLRNYYPVHEAEKAAWDGLKEIRRVAPIIGEGRLGVDGHDFEVPFLVQRRIRGETVRKLLAGEPAVPFQGIQNGAKYLDWVRRLLSVVASVHNLGIHHGSLTPDNFIQDRNERVWLVNFGRAMLERTVPERMEAAQTPLAASEDILHAGHLMLWLATGKEPADSPPRAGRHGAFHEVDEKLRQMNAALMKDLPWLAHVLGRALASAPGERFGTINELLDNLELFERGSGMQGPRDRAMNAKSLIRQIRARVKDLDGRHIRFHGLVERELSSLNRRLTEMVHLHRAEIFGSREELTLGVLEWFASLNQDSWFAATSTLEYWNERNLSPRGRVWQINRINIGNGVRLRRVFLCSTDELLTLKNEALGVLHAQAELVRYARECQKETTNRRLSEPGVFIGVNVCAPQRQRELLRNGFHFALAGDESGNVFSLSFQQDQDNVRRMVLSRMFDKDYTDERHKQLAEIIAGATPIEQWLMENETKYRS